MVLAAGHFGSSHKSYVGTTDVLIAYNGGCNDLAKRASKGVGGSSGGVGRGRWCIAANPRPGLVKLLRD